jgi:predicted trehalose synthase
MMSEAVEPKIEVSGDESGGFIVQVHDGDVAHVYTLFAADADAAVGDALRQFRGEPDEVVQEAKRKKAPAKEA